MPNAALRKIRRSRPRLDEGTERARRSQMMWTVVVGTVVMIAALYRLTATHGTILEPMQDPARSAVGLLAPAPGIDRLPATARAN